MLRLGYCRVKDHRMQVLVFYPGLVYVLRVSLLADLLSDIRSTGDTFCVKMK